MAKPNRLQPELEDKVFWALLVIVGMGSAFSVLVMVSHKIGLW